MFNNDQRYQEFNPNFTYLSPKERVQFRCTLCGDCCLHNKGVVFLEAYDAYRLAKHLGLEVADVYERYCEAMDMEGTGIPIYPLKTVGPDDACVFLKDSRCTVQDSKPKPCRLYPFSVEPKEPDASDFHRLLCKKRLWHFKTGNTVESDVWMRENFPETERKVMQEDWRSIREIVPLLKRAQDMGDACWEKALKLFVLFRFFWFDTDAEFPPQQRRNNLELEKSLKRIV